MKRNVVRAMALILAAVLVLSLVPAAFAMENVGDINFGINVDSGTEVITVTVAGNNDAAFAELAKENKLFALTVDCGFDEAYAIFNKQLVDSTLDADADKIQFAVAKSGEYQIVNGKAPVVTENEDGSCTVTLTENNVTYLAPFTVQFNLANITVKTADTDAEVTDGVAISGRAVSFSKAGTFVVSGNEVPDPVITGVTVSAAGNASSVQAGETLQFSAALEGTNTEGVPVSWRVTGAADPDTTIDSTGLLTVGENETAASLTVTATADGVEGTKTITVEKKEAETPPAPPIYQITKGDKAKWTKNSSSGLTFATDADAVKVTKVEVDGETVDPKHYTVTGTSIALKASYLNELRSGKHTITIHYEDGGKAEGTFSVRLQAFNAYTGDQFPLLLLSGVMVVSLAAVIVLLIQKKKGSRKK